VRSSCQSYAIDDRVLELEFVLQCCNVVDDRGSILFPLQTRGI